MRHIATDNREIALSNARFIDSLKASAGLPRARPMIFF
jgi:hypothetical protein